MKNVSRLFFGLVSLVVFSAVFVPLPSFSAVPAITGITPNIGSPSTAANVTITGSGFEAGAKVSLLNSAPAPAGLYDTPGLATSVYVAGNYAYVADYSSGLQIIDVSNPSSPTLAGSYNTPEIAWDVFIIGNYAYVV